MILPEQKFIDGVATVTGEVRQFVGARMGSRYVRFALDDNTMILLY